MTHYRHSLVVRATPAAAYAALATPEGLRGWWTEDCDVPTRVGETIHFRFGRNHKDFRIERLVPNGEVAWHCTGCHMAAPHLSRRDEWVGTDIVFRLMSEGEGRTRIDFEHIGLVPELECFELCNRGWNYFMPSLQQFLETGRGTPFEKAAQAAVQ
jgi:uncharacterized protein YndB with AHSA1/START domain